MNPEGAGILLTSMDPVVGGEPTILILGSMPGEVSLKAGEYYAHPRNRFWIVIEGVFGIPATASYEERASRLVRNGVALWDVLKHCTRIGSLDSDIRRDTEVSNDLSEFLDRHPTVERIVFNGQKAEASFQRLVLAKLPLKLQRQLQTAVAPSTSPANAKLMFPALIAAWRVALNLTA
jgi:double-stranded uracil-DNA glycosylase